MFLVRYETFRKQERNEECLNNFGREILKEVVIWKTLASTASLSKIDFKLL
jgi:hypothetical protein